MYNPFASFRKPRLGDQEHVGVCVDNNDPLKLQRVRIRLPWLKNVPDNQLPWCMPGQHAGYGQMSNESGGQLIVPIGSKVFVRLQGNNMYSPIYKQGPTTQDKKIDELANRDDYQYVQGSIDPAGNYQHVITGGEKAGEMVSKHVSGTVHSIDKDGNTSVLSSHDHKHGTHGSHKVASNGDMTHSSKGVHKIMGSTVRINSDGPEDPDAFTPRTKPQAQTPGQTGF